MQRLIALLNKNLRIEAGIKTIILGDFNQDFLSEKQEAKEILDQLRELEFQ